jgi:hypothetical protein
LTTLGSGGDATQAWTCNETVGRGDGRDLCTGFDPTACKSGLCEQTNCAAPCGRDADCMGQEHCSYLEWQSLVPPVTSLLGRCSAASITDFACCTNADCEAPSLCKPKSMGTFVGMVCQAP